MGDSPGMEGEDLATRRWEDARHWIGIYTDLLRFRVRIRSRLERNVHNLDPKPDGAIASEVALIEQQMDHDQVRLDLWYARLWDLNGLTPDSERRVIRPRPGPARIFPLNS